MYKRQLHSHGLQHSYLTQLWQRLPGEHGENMPALVRWTEQHCPNGAALIRDAQDAQVAANLTVGNIITTLRMVGQVEWNDLIEPVSRSLRVLRELPSFAAESESTRQQITHAMEQVARQSRRSEREVAQAVVRLAIAAAHDGIDTREPDVDPADETAGYYLFGQGLPALDALLRPNPEAAGQRARRAARHGTRSWRLPLYAFAVVLFTCLLYTSPSPRD